MYVRHTDMRSHKHKNRHSVTQTHIRTPTLSYSFSFRFRTPQDQDSSFGGEHLVFWSYRCKNKRRRGTIDAFSSEVISYLICILSSLFDIFSFESFYTSTHAPLQHNKPLTIINQSEKIPKIYFSTSAWLSSSYRDVRTHLKIVACDNPMDEIKVIHSAVYLALLNATNTYPSFGP